MFLKSYFPYDGQNSARIRKNNGKDNKFEYNLQIFESYEKSKDVHQQIENSEVVTIKIWNGLWGRYTLFSLNFA